MNKKQKKKVIIIITILVIVDQIIKIFALFSDLKIENMDKLSFGILSTEKTENNISYILIAIIAIGVIIRYIESSNSYIKMNSRVVLSIALAGIISNLIDRIWKGQVINYINIPGFTQINLSYIYIIITWIGMAVILTKYTANRIEEKKAQKSVTKKKNKE